MVRAFVAPEAVHELSDALGARLDRIAVGTQVLARTHGEDGEQTGCTIRGLVAVHQPVARLAPAAARATSQSASTSLASCSSAMGVAVVP